MKMHHNGKYCGTGKRVPIRVTKVRNDWKWCLLPRNEGLMCGNRCWPRSFDQNNKSFTEAEEDLIIKLHSLLGNRWALIAGRLPDRTENEVKAYWNSKLRAKLLKNEYMHSKKRKTSLNVTQTPEPLQVADATSGIEEDSGETRGLNLNLSMSMSSSSLLDGKERGQANTIAHSPSIDAENIGIRTLLLFQ